MSGTEKFSMKLEKKQNGNVFYLYGQLDLAVVEWFKSNLLPYAESPEQPLCLNLRDLKYIDSSGIGMLVYFIKLRHSLKAPFEVVEVPQKIQRLFDITGISKFLSLKPAESKERI